MPSHKITNPDNTRLRGRRIVETVVAVNEHRKRAMARKVAAVFGETLRDTGRAHMLV
jgi:hypothetical protein